MPKIYESQKYAVENDSQVNILVMDLLGENLHSVFKSSEDGFDIKTSCQYGL